MLCCCYLKTLSMIPEYQFNVLCTMHDLYEEYAEDEELTMSIKFVLADEVLCMLATQYGEGWKEDEHDMGDPEERGRVVELINQWIYDYKYGC